MRYLRQLLQTWSLLTLTVALGALLGLRVLHYQLLEVQTDSMVPVFQPHDVLLVHPATDHEQVRVGEIVTYRSNSDLRQLVSHRVVAIDNVRHTVRTQGDRLTYADPPIATTSIVGRVTTVVPTAGKAVDALKHPVVMAVLFYVPMILLVGEEIVRLGHHFKRQQPYLLPEHRAI